ncbi:DegT/DnrJ/EryC1/StrS family aminotransferase [Mongoliibacter ruber]|uniref:dTDP-4-amino-4,6-dideoxygalactose transaminase n=1 Tax=Mongoliibacter ruber TaxID=1750599 RepID=A0A2T0WNT1_9BACT|nr:DegT/DnrJ/EryC1/StrS family aminotransferase [Mongoliibacter ruber]PRY88356.1 dTDP-4-amino-4,6-dideoxygalactose transaminase [Mongoliibacter ruber]
MQQEKIWLSPPHMGGSEIDYIQEAFELNWIAPAGQNLDKFERDLVARIGCGNALAMTSGTAAIHLSLILMDVQPGDYVLCQSMTFCASVNPVRYLGGIPVLIDSENETWNMDPALLEQAIQDCMDGSIVEKNPSLKSLVGDSPAKKPKAIIPIHLYGMPAKIEEICAIAAKYQIPVLEDAAEAIGSKVDGQHCGSFGDIGVVSFNGNKIITTSGGGAMFSKNKSWIDRAKFLSTQAKENRPYYHHEEIGYNYRLSNVLAGIGRGQLEVLDQRVQSRRANFEYYQNQLGHLPGFFFLEEPEGFYSNRWLTCILIDPKLSGGVDSEQVRLALEKENIESRPLWKPMHKQPVFKDFPFYGSDIAERLFEQGLCLPSGSSLSEKDLNRVVTVVKSIII